MRLLDATLRHYRIHQELSVRFAPEVTLIGGPNECGKSTLVEALHRALFLRAKTTGEVQKSMVSRLASAGHPEVELRFAVGDAVWTIFKRFSGASGSARLQREGGESYQDAEAEERLHQLLQVEEVGGGRGVRDRILQQWGHLWVWQGKSGDDPCVLSESEQPRLLQRLQEAGGAAALLSAGDTAAASHFAEQRKGIFQASGKAKKGSALERAQSELAEAEAAETAARETLARRERALAAFEAASEQIRQIEESQQVLRDERRRNAELLERIAGLREQTKTRQALARQAAERLAEIQRLERQVADFERQEAETRQSLAPREAELQRLAERLAERRQEGADLATQAEAARLATQRERQRLDLLRAAIRHFEKRESVSQLEAKAARIATARQQQSQAATQLAELPPVAEPDLKALRQQETAVLKAGSALEAMAAGVLLEAAERPVQLDGTPLLPGSERTVTEAAEITCEGLKLVIRPGGGESLAEARRRREQAAEALRDALARLGVDSLAAASEVAARRSVLQQALAQIGTSLEHLDAAGFDEHLRAARNELEAARAELERRQQLLPDLPAPGELPLTRAEISAAETALEGCESEEKSLAATLAASQRHRTELEKALEKQQGTITRERQEADAFRAKLQFLIEQHGDATRRATALSEARHADAEATAALEQTQAALQVLEPAAAERDKVRLERAWERCQQQLGDERTRQAVAHSELRFDGREDPATALAEAQERLERARRALHHAQEHAEAIRLLDDLFSEQQRSLSERFTQPLADRISDYLRCLFGPTARAEITLQEQRFSGIRLLRDGRGLDLFTDLSGGAREQVAAAVRLATAELLAPDHLGCLPLVFDDAFAFSDPTRVRTLQRMLDQATQRGLQLILLSCNPSDYAALGAETVSLPAPALTTAPAG